MKTISKLLFFSFVILALLIPMQRAQAAGLPDEVVTGSYTLKSGETLNDNLTVLGGNATLEEGSTVDGDVKVLGGNVTIAGEIDGDIQIIGGNVELKDGAHVTGDIERIGGYLSQAEGATVDGSIEGPRWGSGNWDSNFDNVPFVPGYYENAWDNPFGSLLSFLLRAFVISALAVVVAIFWPRQAQMVGATAIRQPLISGGLGLLTVFVVPVLVIALILTIIGIPIAALLLILVSIMVMFGWIAIGMEIGHRLAQAFHADWALPLEAGLGTLLLTFVTDGAALLLSCFGSLLPALVGLVALGAVLLTRFGTQPYVAGGRGGFVPVSPVTPIAPTAAAPSGSTTVVTDNATVTTQGGATVYPASEGPTEPPVIFPDDQG